MLVSLLPCRKCFISADDTGSLNAFVKAARKYHPVLQYIKVSDFLWETFLYKMAEEFRKGPDFSMKTLVSCIGRQRCSRVWAFNETAMVGLDGKRIPLEQQEYYW